MATMLLSQKVEDARAAMCALIESRALPLREDDPGYVAALAELAWKIADAMGDEHMKRASGRKGDR